MTAALYDEAGGYYKRSDLKRWGREGDYRTSPERSELFAATFARYFAKLYDELQRPPEWTIVEAGGGAGDFAAGVQRSLHDYYRPVFEATRYVSTETNDELQALTPIEAGIFFSNEVLDAFPVHRVTRTGDELSELYITLNSEGQFVWSNGPLSTPRLLEFCREYAVELEDGQFIEINLEIDDWLLSVAAKLERGYLISVDYGAESFDLYDVALRPNGTLRAFSRHGFIDDVLIAPGDYDITSSVNWSQVQAVGGRLGFTTVAFAQQDRFLLDAGLLEELQRRMSSLTSEADKLSLTAGAREMILPGGMGSSFQVLVQKKGN
ncbi:MAG TPA: SAM-dependent methyltransferase [Pyrinomonadaceae bacterium]|nr:SAM-dependent methyltransferase [Pyrinomonadaceae bacterium]